MNKIVQIFFKPSAGQTKWFLLPIIIVLVVAGMMGYMNPVVNFLDSKELTFVFGKFEFSVYTAIKAIFSVILVFWIAAFISGFGEKRIRSIRGIRSSNRDLLLKGFQSLTYFIAFIVGLDFIGIDFTALTVLGGAVGIGIGFGLQKITSNFISGIILLFEKSIENGDLIELSDGTYGFIRKMGARFTLIETFDGKEILIPNEDFITNRVTNWTYNNNHGRVDIILGVSYGCDIKKARELILEAAREHPRSLKEPEPTCFLTDFGDSSVNFLLYFWVEDVTEGRYQPKSEVLFTIWDKFKENNIEIPFPQRDIHIKNSEIFEAISGRA